MLLDTEIPFDLADAIEQSWWSSPKEAARLRKLAHAAARTIQGAWRGWLVRTQLQLAREDAAAARATVATCVAAAVAKCLQVAGEAAAAAEVSARATVATCVAAAVAKCLQVERLQLEEEAAAAAAAHISRLQARLAAADAAATVAKCQLEEEGASAVSCSPVGPGSLNSSSGGGSLDTPPLASSSWSTSTDRDSSAPPFGQSSGGGGLPPLLGLPSQSSSDGLPYASLSSRSGGLPSSLNSDVSLNAQLASSCSQEPAPTQQLARAQLQQQSREGSGGGGSLPPAPAASLLDFSPAGTAAMQHSSSASASPGGGSGASWSSSAPYTGQPYGGGGSGAARVLDQVLDQWPLPGPGPGPEPICTPERPILDQLHEWQLPEQMHVPGRVPEPVQRLISEGRLVSGGNVTVIKGAGDGGQAQVLFVGYPDGRRPHIRLVGAAKVPGGASNADPWGQAKNLVEEAERMCTIQDGCPRGSLFDGTDTMEVRVHAIMRIYRVKGRGFFVVKGFYLMMMHFTVRGV
jgi:hypothetical protein